MSFADEICLTVKAGHGGSGCASFRKEKFVPLGGPDGGDGGDGGNVIVSVCSKTASLFELKKKTLWKAQNGRPGKPQKQTGKKGLDLIINVPAGTLIYSETGEIIADLKVDSEPYLLAKGGLGGKGNQHFANSRKQAPTYSQTGIEGETLSCRFELRMIAHVGLIGLPNAGKSSLLKTLTSAKTKIGDYPFTTLSPNLGILKDYEKHIVIADIPGLVEGASKGVGLGNTFLKHIDRTQILIHLIDASLDDLQSILNNYKTILDELQQSPYEFHKKQQLVILNKIDACDDLELLTSLFNDLNVKTLAISCKHYQGIDTLIDSIKAMYKKEFF